MKWRQDWNLALCSLEILFRSLQYLYTLLGEILYNTSGSVYGSCFWFYSCSFESFRIGRLKGARSCTAFMEIHSFFMSSVPKSGVNCTEHICEELSKYLLWAIPTFLICYIFKNFAPFGREFYQPFYKLWNFSHIPRKKVCFNFQCLRADVKKIVSLEKKWVVPN